MTNAFNGTLASSETISATVDGFTIEARLEHDSDHGTPWDEECGHGPVSDWTRRAKAPGERVLCQDREMKRYYDFAQAVQIAKRDGWGSAGDSGLSRKAKAAKAAESDFERLRLWAADHWHYVGVVLSVSRNGVELDRHAASIWGIESDAGDYLTDVANELLDEALECGRATVAQITA